MWLKIKSQFLKSLPLTPNGKEFITSALGKDSEILNDGFVEKLWSDFEKIRVLVPQLAKPSCMVEGLEALGLEIRGENFVPGSVSGWIGRATGGTGIFTSPRLEGLGGSASGG